MDGRLDGGFDAAIGRRAALKAGGSGLLALSLAGCIGPANIGERGLNPPSSDTIEQGGVFTIGVTDPPAGTNPLAVSSEESYGMLDLLYGFGTTVDPLDFGVHPSVFANWSEHHTETPTAKPTVRFTVREGLTFTDGTDCSVEDVLFTYRYLLDHRPEKYASMLDPIESVERVSSSRFDLSMQLSELVSTYDSVQLAVPVLPKHIWKDIASPAEYRPTDHGGPVGLGPARVKTYDPDTAIELAFREDYPLADLEWKRKKEELLHGGPFLDGLRYRVYEDDTALETAFRRGDVDAMYGSHTAEEIKPLLDSRNLVRGSGEGYKAFGFNLRRTPLDDLPFRQALGFAFDDRYWVERLNDGHVISGDFVAPPDYTAVRPEHQPSILPRPVRPASQQLLAGPSTEAFAFRETDDGSLDVEGIRSFLTEGALITGGSGTFAGERYPGSLTGVEASQTEAKYEYTFGPVESGVLKAADTEQELRVDGTTITAIHEGPLALLTRPASEYPEEAKMTRRYASALRRIGIPIERRELPSEKLRTAVYRDEEFAIAPIDGESVSEFAIETLYERFHSDNADDHGTTDIGTRKNTDEFVRNATGYGLTESATADDLIAAAREEMAVESRNDLIRRAIERVYLDIPVIVASYEKLYWPTNRIDFDGYVESLPAPGDTYLSTELLQLHRASTNSVLVARR